MVGKRSQVRVRVTLRTGRLINLAKNVVIMGHSRMDFDVLGAAVGVRDRTPLRQKVRIIIDYQNC